MTLILDDGTPVPVTQLTFSQWRHFMAAVLQHSPHAHTIWDVMACVRGPDTPSERPDMSPSEHNSAYGGRRHRKRQTVEVLRHVMFHGTCGGQARHREGTSVTLPPANERDHFDRHVALGASILGLTVKTKPRAECLKET
jgi:hypothetical protein